MTCEVHNKEINSQCAELLVRPLYYTTAQYYSNTLYLFINIDIFTCYSIYRSFVSHNITVIQYIYL